MTAIIVHGGAGDVASERHERVRAGVRAAADAGHAILAAGGSALDAVVAAVRVLEDDPEFNAGTGSALTRDGTVETDASIMDGTAQRVGAVAAVPDLGCAIALARAVLDAGEHAILAGPAAWRFAAEVGIAPAAPGSLVTQRARDRLAAWLARGAGGASSGGASSGGASSGGASSGGPSSSGPSSGGVPSGGPASGGASSAGPSSGGTARPSSGGTARPSSGGTVGAVARDGDGRFAAATSTGGIVGKRSGRVGDSPIAGAGTWADRDIAISATGDGEAILRVALARGVATRCAAGMTLRDAAHDALAELARITGGTAGVIGVDRRGIIGVQLSNTMPIAYVDDDGTRIDSLGTRV